MQSHHPILLDCIWTVRTRLATWPAAVLAADKFTGTLTIGGGCASAASASTKQRLLKAMLLLLSLLGSLPGESGTCTAAASSAALDVSLTAGAARLQPYGLQARSQMSCVRAA